MEPKNFDELVDTLTYSVKAAAGDLWSKDVKDFVKTRIKQFVEQKAKQVQAISTGDSKAAKQHAGNLMDLLNQVSGEEMIVEIKLKKAGRSFVSTHLTMIGNFFLKAGVTLAKGALGIA